MPSLQSRLLAHWIRRMNLFDITRYEPQEIRQRSDQAGMLTTPRRDVQVLPVDANGVPAEWHIPPAAPPGRALLYLHGGAWMIGSPKLYRRFVSQLAHMMSVRALVIDYRLAPENPFPAGLEDCLTAYQFLLQSGFPPEQIAIAGDSAGGNLTLASLVALRERGLPLPAAAVAISPATDLSGSSESYIARRSLDPFFYRMDTGSASFIRDYITTHDPRDPYISPVYADLHGLPPLLIHVGEHEILYDDAVRFSDKASQAGVDVQLVIWPGMFHVFHIWNALLPEARRANAQIAEYLRGKLVS